MSSQAPSSAALPIAHVVLKVLIVLNWLLGAGILTLLVALPHERWIMSELGLYPSPETDRVVLALRTVAVIGLVATPLHYLVLKRLLTIVATVRGGDAFIAANADRLRAIGWTLLVLQLLSLVVGAIDRTLSAAGHPIDLNAGFSVNGWLAVLLTFVLARVFAEGARMRDDIEGTV